MAYLYFGGMGHDRGNDGLHIDYKVLLPFEWSTGNSGIRKRDWAPAVDSHSSHRPNRHLSSASSSSSSGSSAHGSSAVHKTHQHDALVFLFNAILVGTGVLHLASIYHGIQLSITLFVLGMVLSLILEGFKIKDDLLVFGDSYVMWMDIDPHLLLFTMLPTLLAGDAMTIDTSVARRVFKQCLFLAGPGVVVMSAIVAVFLVYWLQWSFMLSLCTGSILCATDPVAVVALLKELGASPTLTVQIQGESLLNDGTAIVLYTVAYDILRGVEYDFADVAMFIVKTAIMALALGVFLGYFFFTFIRAASDRFNHSSAVIQILLTICAAYWSFVLAEGVLKMSGVLATVGCSLVLAQNMWPYIVDRTAMLGFWHAFENLGNIIIFFLGGALTGAAMVNIAIWDYLNLLVIYLVLLVLRGGFIFASRPILKFLHKDKETLTVEDALVMTWGGLRGAVGLALGIQVRRGRALGADGLYRLDEQEANRVLFFVGGIAFLTTCVNATTCPMLVSRLGITSLPEAEACLLQKFNQQLVSFSQSKANPKEVTDQLEAMLESIATTIGGVKSRASTIQKVPLSSKASSASLGSARIREREMQPADQIVEKYNEFFESFSELSDTDKKHLDSVQDDCAGQVKQMLELIQRKAAEMEICKSLNNIFLACVHTNYWRRIANGDLIPGSEEADLLFTSIRFSHMKPDLDDYRFLKRFSNCGSGEAVQMALARSSRRTVKVTVDSKLGQFVTSGTFNISCAVAILTNVFFVAFESLSRADDDDSKIWLVVEAIFAAVFLLEFLIKFSYLWMDFFRSIWNVFDFSLVILGLLGLVMSILSVGANSGSSGSESRVIRISRVLRTMRFLRLFRLFHASLGKDPLISEELANTMKRLSILNNFIVAHIGAQKSMLKFFAGSVGSSEEVELCRSVLQSQISVLEASREFISVLEDMKPELVVELQNTKFRKGVIEKLENRIDQARGKGALSDTNASALLHPLHHELSSCLHTISKMREGCQAIDDGHGHGHGHELPAAAAQQKQETDALLAAPADVVACVPEDASMQVIEEGDAAAGIKATVIRPQENSTGNAEPDPSPDPPTSPDAAGAEEEEPDSDLSLTNSPSASGKKSPKRQKKPVTKQRKWGASRAASKQLATCQEEVGAKESEEHDPELATSGDRALSKLSACSSAGSGDVEC